MALERRQQVHELLVAALEREADQRAAFLRTACGEDEELRREVEARLGTYERTSSTRVLASSLEACVPDTPAEQGPSLEGRQLGHYRVQTLLGRGGMGEVYMAQDLRLGRSVAIKLLPADLTAHPDRLRRFKQEARLASALTHPNILTVYEVGEQDGLHFLATELVEGESLRQRMKREPIELPQALDLVVQVASALAAAHAAGVVHRDIKPENLMLRRDGYVKILDFGLAKLAGPQAPVPHTQALTQPLVRTEPGVVQGTVAYMSPEQARGQEVDARTDIWSLGVVLYEMVAGRLPLSGPTWGDVLAEIVKSEPPALTRYAPEAPAELERIVSKALCKDREERYQLAKDMALDLRSLKKRMEFEAELGRSMPPELGSEAAAQSGQAAVSAGRAARSTPGAGDAIAGLRRYRWSAALALAVLIAVAASATYLSSLRGERATIDSMAVLPFVNAAADPDTEYLADGISESLTNSLSQLPDLRMIARTSVLRYKGRDVDLQTVARELRVQAVLTGRIVRRGDSLSISAELVDARDNSHIWGEQYNRKASDILVVQQEIARAISERLRAHLTGEELRRVDRNYTENVESYELYLRGRHHWNKRTADGLRQAIQYFQQAIDRDPNYALAFSGLADCYSNLQGYAGAPASDMLPRARAAALRALEIDPSLAEAHASLGLNHYQSWEWAEAQRELERAIELNPNYASAHQWYSLWLEVMGRADEALGEGRRSQELDPLSPMINTNLARSYVMRGDLDTAMNECRKVIELNPDFPQAHVILAAVYQKQGRHEEAIAELQKAVELSGRGHLPLCALGYGYAAAGRRSEAHAILRELEERHASGEVMGGMIAWIYAGLGDKDQAFASLEREFQGRGGTLTNAILIYPYFDTLRGDRRYAELLRRMGLPQRM